MMQRIYGVRILAALGVCAAMTGCGAVGTAQARLAITGYAPTDTTNRAILRSAPALATVGVDGINIGASGDSVGEPDSGAYRLLRRAHALRLRGELLVANYEDSIGDFSPDAASGLLGSSANIDTVTRKIGAEVAAHGWNGVTVDLEALNSSHKEGLVAFLKSMRAVLPAGRSLSVDVGASTTEAGYAAAGFDLKAIAPIVDRVVLMAYDEHGPTWSGAGPIGGLDWTRHSLVALLQGIPAQKTDLGVAGFGYTWPTHGVGTSIGDAQARLLVRRAGVEAHWSARYGEWHATLPDGTLVWWSDARTWRLHRAIARLYHLHGMALWSLSQSDAIPRS